MDRQVVQRQAEGGGFPWLTLLLAIPALGAQVFPPLLHHLQYDRAAIAAGEIWRIFTGHVTHWTWEQLLWDAAVFVVLGSIIERTRRDLLAMIVASAAVISLGLLAFSPEIQLYRGLSGLDSTLFAALVVGVFRAGFHERRPGLALAAGALLLAFLAKCVFELATGTTVFVDAARSGMIPLPGVHLLGAAAGGLLALGAEHGSPLRRQAASNRVSPDGGEPFDHHPCPP